VVYLLLAQGEPDSDTAAPSVNRLVLSASLLL
jgi:hypothetical protein